MATPLHILFGRRVRQLRKAQGLTQEGLARKANLDFKYLGAVERGERNLTFANAEKILKGLGVQPYEGFMFNWEEGGKVDDEKVVRSLLQRADPALRHLVISLVQEVLKWQAPKRK